MSRYVRTGMPRLTLDVSFVPPYWTEYLHFGSRGDRLFHSREPDNRDLGR